MMCLCRPGQREFTADDRLQGPVFKPGRKYERVAVNQLDLTPEQEADLDRRIEEAEKHPGRGIPAAEVMGKLFKKFQ